MWDYILIWQAIGWLVLIFSLPWTVTPLRKIVRHLSYLLFPKDTLLEYIDEGRIVEAYYVRQSFFRKPSFRKLSESELLMLEAKR